MLDDVWMPPAHAQHKESMLCQTKGVSICPHTFGCPIVWMPPDVYVTPQGPGPHHCDT